MADKDWIDIPEEEWIDLPEKEEWKDIPAKVYEPPITGEGRFRGAGVTGTWKELTPIQKAGQAIKEIAAAPVRTIESMLGSIGGLIRMGAESATIGEVITKHINIPGAGIIAEHLVRRYGPKKALSFYDRKMEKHADAGKKISDFWNEQANKGWEAPNPDIVEARWSERPISKTVSAVSSGLTSIGVVLGATFLTKSPHPGLAILAGSETGAMYDRLRNEKVPPGIASKLAQLAGAWTYATEKIGFDRLLAPSKVTILNILKKSGWEGAQEVAEQIGHNLLEYFGYNYRKPRDIPTAVKAAYDHAMDGWFDALVGGIGAGGLSHIVLHRNVDRKKRLIKEAEVEVAATAELEQLESPPTVEQLTGKKIEDIAPQTADHAIGHQYGLTNKQIDRRLQQAEFRYRELKRVPIVSELALTKRETGELAFLKENRANIEALLERDAISKSDRARNKSKLPTRPAPPPVRAQMGEGRLRALAQKLRKSAKLSDAEFSNLADITTDKLSIEDMNKAQLINFVSALEESYSTYGELAPADYHKEVIVNGPLMPMSVVHREALDSIEKLKSKKEADAIIKIPGIKARIKKSWQWTKSFTAGIKNTPVFHLARRLDGGIGDIFSRVFDKGIERGRKKAARLIRVVTDAIVKTLEERGVTPADLAKMGRSLNPRLQTHQMISEGAATEVLDIEIEGRIKGKAAKKTYQMTMAELIDVYLINNQKDGRRHLRGGGLIINGTRTGSLSKDQINALIQRVENNPKAKQVVATILEIGEIWKRQINYVSQHLDDKDIATVKDWWGLEVYGPARKKLLGRAVTPEEILVEMKIADIEIGGKQELNLIENQSIFKDRTKSKAPLIVRDAFNRLNVFTNAIAEYIGLAGPTRTARTLINDPEVVAMLKEKGYDNVREAIAKIHKRAETIPASEGEFTAWFSKHLPNLYRAVLYFNPRVIASQKTSAFNYGAYVSPEFITATNLISAFKPSEAMETTELSDIAWERYHMARSSLELGEIAESDAALRMWTGGKASDKNWMGWTLKTADLSALTDGMKLAQEEYKAFKRDGKLTGLSEEWWRDKDPDAPWHPDADIELWRKVKERKKTIAENPLTEEENAERLRAEAWQKVVSERAEYLWQRTQPSWDKWNRSLLTSEKGLKRVFLLFRSFHEKSLTVFNEAMLDYQNSARTNDDIVKFAVRSGSVIAGYMFNTTIRAAIMTAMAVPVGLAVGGRIQPDKKEWTKYFEDLVMSWFAAFPILGKVAKAAISRMVDTWIDVKPSYTGEPLGSLPIDVANNALKVPIDFGDAVGHLLADDKDDALEAFERGMKRLITAVGLLTGFPMYEIKRLVTPKKEPKGKKKKVKW